LSTTEDMLRHEQNIQTSIEEAVLNYAKLANAAGLDPLGLMPGVTFKNDVPNFSVNIRLSRGEQTKTAWFDAYCSW
jgi:orotidine-5'-phosphate decarboxylase